MRRVAVLAIAALVLLALPVVASADTFLPLALHNRSSAATVVPTDTVPATSTFTPTATATATATLTPTATATATATPSPTPTATPHWVELITDGGFKQGPYTPWL